jgi:hypothetical protein
MVTLSVCVKADWDSGILYRLVLCVVPSKRARRMRVHVQRKRSVDCLCVGGWSDLPSGLPSTRPLTLCCRADRPSQPSSGADGVRGGRQHYWKIKLHPIPLHTMNYNESLLFDLLLTGGREECI